MCDSSFPSFQVSSLCKSFLRQTINSQWNNSEIRALADETTRVSLWWRQANRKVTSETWFAIWKIHYPINWGRDDSGVSQTKGEIDLILWPVTPLVNVSLRLVARLISTRERCRGRLILKGAFLWCHCAARLFFSNFYWLIDGLLHVRLYTYADVTFLSFGILKEIFIAETKFAKKWQGFSLGLMLPLHGWTIAG